MSTVTDKLPAVAGDVRAQMVQAFENLKAALAEVGATFKDVVKITNYLVDGAHVQDYREIRDKYVNTAAPPASDAARHLAAGARGMAVRDRCCGGVAGEMIGALRGLWCFKWGRVGA